jgi:peptidoglycan/LPS O-acetylase OafA/YrhL
VPAIAALSTGGAGVSLFFVLSGFLITRILLSYKAADVPASQAARHFYVRRFLRLSPPFYLAIAIAALLASPQMRDSWWVHALYLTNFKIGWAGHWTGGADHFWSLCVEEQFYICWFIVAMAVPLRRFGWAIFAACALCVLYRVGMYAFSWNYAVNVLLPAHTFTLATGGLIALAGYDSRYAWVDKLFSSRTVLLVAGLAFVLVSLSLRTSMVFPRVMLYPTVGAVFFGALIKQATAVSPDKLLDWLSWAPLRHIGKISYGLFVYHMFIPRDWVSHMVGGHPWLVFLTLAVISLVIAELSWRLVETPILRVKDRFEIPARPARAAPELRSRNEGAAA